MAKKGQGIFRSKLGLERDPKYKQQIQRTIKRCLVDTLPDFNAREYLNGKLDQLDKLDETLDKLDHELVEAQEAIKTFNATQHFNNTDEIQLIDTDQPQRILTELKQRESLLQTTSTTNNNKVPS